MDDFQDFNSPPASDAFPPAATEGFGFDEPIPAAADGDEVNDFLAREAALRQQLGETDEQVFGGSPAFIPSGGNNNSAPLSPQGQQQTQEPASSIFSSSSPTSAAAPPIPQESVSMVKKALDCEPVKQWRQKQEKAIAERNAAALKKKEASINRARVEIDEFYATYNEKKVKQSKRNREEESTYKKTQSEAPKSQLFWDLVGCQIDFNAVPGKSSKAVAGVVPASGSGAGSKSGAGSNASASSAVAGAASGGDQAAKKDMTRFKSLLLQLKSDPKAPGNVAQVAVK